MTDLSPAAQAVLNALLGTPVNTRQVCDGKAARVKLAAALRAAVDHVVPEQVNGVGDQHDEARHDQWMRIRFRFLALAAELEALPND